MTSQPHELVCSVPPEPVPIRLDVARCMICGRRRPVCCASAFRDDVDGTTHYREPHCSSCCRCQETL
jgi:hypothetical protein